VIRAGLFDMEIIEGFGADIYRMFKLVFISCSGIAAVAGVIIGTMRSIHPVMDVDFIIVALIVIVIGGLGSFKGALVGSLILGMAEAFGAQLMPGLARFTTWILIATILLFRPERPLPEK
jgi:branched-chain amino acid transport system permease protein